MSSEVIDFLQERFHRLAYGYYQEKSIDKEICSVDCMFFEMLLEEVEVDSVDNEDFLIFQQAILKANRFPVQPLYKTLSVNLLQWIVYSKYTWSGIKLDNIDEIIVDFNTNFNHTVDKFRNVLLSFGLTVFSGKTADSNKQNVEAEDKIVECSHTMTHPHQCGTSSIKYEVSEETGDRLPVTNIYSSLYKSKVCTHANIDIIPGNDPLTVDTALPSSRVAEENICEDFSGMVVSENSLFHSSEHFNTTTNKYTDLDNDIIEIFRTLQKTDILRLLGIGKTVGSVELLPPPLWTMWQSYCKIHHPKSKLIVGARALSKHCHRSSDCWWGDCSGTEGNKNKHALKLLETIFVDISWINMHTLPHSVFVLEVRCSEGYGLRWSHDGKLFRGFLEPQMIDGHDKKWKH